MTTPNTPYGETAAGTTAERLRTMTISDDARERVSALALRYWEWGAYAALFVSAIILRFYELGNRAIHHDESLHAFYAWQFSNGIGEFFTLDWDTRAANVGYHHVPFMHGPFQFIGSGFLQWIFGDGDYQSRLLAAIMGTGLVALPILLRKQLGIVGALVAAAFIAFSPTLLYYSRFTREDIYTAFWTLAIVAFAWKYVETRKQAWLFAAIGCMAGSFLTKETTHLTIIGFLLIFEVLLARHFAGQINASRTRTPGKDETVIDVLIAIVLVFVAWLIALTWPFTEDTRKRWGLTDFPAEGDVLVIMGTIALPMYAALVQAVPGHALLLREHSATSGTCANLDWRFCTGGADSHIAGAEQTVAWVLIFFLIGISAVAGTLWNPRFWLIAAACFWAPYILFSTTFFTNLDGFPSVLWGSVDYWVGQQYERRGDQPDYYYFVTIPVYEFLPLALAAIGGVYYLIRGSRTQALILAGIAALVLLMLAVPGEYDYRVIKCPEGTIGIECKPSSLIGTSVLHIILPFLLIFIAVLSFPLERFTRFLMAWLVFTTLFLTVAGEKMPWLNVHIALPLIILAAKFVGDMLRDSDLRDDLPAIERIAPFLYAAVAAALAIVIFLIAGPLAPAAVGAWALIAVAVVSVFWAYREYSKRTAWQAAMLAVVAAVAVFTAFVAQRASWGDPNSNFVGQPGDVATRDYGEVPTELLVYTQTSGDIPVLRDRIAEYAREVSGLGNRQPIVVDDDDGYTWPWAWYLRDYPVSYARVSGDYTPPPCPTPAPPQGQPNTNPPCAIFLVKDSNATNLRLPGYEPGIRYHHRRWFHEEYRGHNTSDNPGVYSSQQFYQDIVSPHQWGFWLDFFFNREVPFDAPGTVDGMAFFPLGSGTFSLEPEGPTVRTEGTQTIIGVRGFAKGELEAPSDVALDADGNLYVADSNNDRIEKYDADGNFLAYAGGFGSDIDMTQPWAISVAADGTVFVANTWAHQVIKLDRDLKEIDRWGQGGQTEAGGDPFGLYGPRDIVVAPNGNVLITDTGNARVVEYTADGEFVRQFGSLGTSGAPLEFSEPTGIEMNAAGDIYVADFVNKRVVILDANLALRSTIAIDSWGSTSGTDKGYMALLDDGRLLVTDPANSQVLAYGADGAPLGAYDVPVEGNTGASRPIGIASDGESVWVSDSLGHVVRKIPLSEIIP